MRKLFCVAALTFIAVAAFSQGMPRDAVILGERTVDFHGNHDVIPGGDYKGFFKSIGFWVEKNNIEIFDFVVTYGDGQQQRFGTRLVFDEGTKSRMLRLEGVSGFHPIPGRMINCFHIQDDRKVARGTGAGCCLRGQVVSLIRAGRGVCSPYSRGYEYFFRGIDTRDPTHRSILSCPG